MTPQSGLHYKREHRKLDRIINRLNRHKVPEGDFYGFVRASKDLMAAASAGYAKEQEASKQLAEWERINGPDLTDMH